MPQYLTCWMALTDATPHNGSVKLDCGLELMSGVQMHVSSACAFR